MARRARTLCIYLDCGKTIEVGKRSIHLVEEHGILPPLRWLDEHNLPEDATLLAKALKKDRRLRPPFTWLCEYFVFPNARNVD